MNHDLRFKICYKIYYILLFTALRLDATLRGLQRHQGPSSTRLNQQRENGRQEKVQELTN